MLNLIHYYVQETNTLQLTEEQADRRRRLDNVSTGALLTHLTVAVVEKHTVRPPSWWVDDDDASQSSLLAMQQMRTGV